MVFRSEPTSHAPLFAAALVFFALTILVWGLFPFDRGPFQDDVTTLASTKSLTTVADRFFSPVTAPTRRLVRIPYALALQTRSPWPFLQGLYGFLWLLSGALSSLVVLQVLPRHRWLAYAAGCLTLCSTGDYLFDSLVSLAYDLSAVCFFGALCCLLKCWRSENLVWMLPSAALLSGSLWTADAAFASVILAPPILAIVVGRTLDRRTLLPLAVWYLAFLPYFVEFARFLSDPHSYAAVAIVPSGWSERIERSILLFLHNFDPWSWGPARTNWFPALSRVLPVSLCLALAILGALVFLAGHSRFLADWPGKTSAPAVSSRRLFLFAGASLLLAFASNATFAAVQYSQFFYRTQTVSRYWASIAVATLGFAGARNSAWRRVVATALAALVGFGVYGGLDRQDYYLAYWKRHQAELRSILDAAPRLAPSASLVLFIPHPMRYFAATQAAYLAQSWTSLLYDDRSMWTRTMLIEPYGDQKCRVEADEIVCRDSKSIIRSAVPSSNAVILKYDDARNRYTLAEAIPPELHPVAGAGRSAYDPKKLIVREHPRPLAARMLLEADR